MKEIVKRLENQYDIKIEDFIDLYELDYGRDTIAKKLNLGVFQVRMIASTLGLRWKKKHRIDDLEILQMKLNSEEDLVVSLTSELEFANKKLLQMNKSLQKCRDENTAFRRQQRLLNREEFLLEKIADDFKTKLKTIYYPTIKPLHRLNGEGLTLLCFSDLHIGAKINKDEVGELNEYSYDIAIKRVEQVLEELKHSPIQNKKVKLLLLGDIFDGIIHNSYLISDIPVTKAIAQFSSYIVKVLNSLSENYEVSIDIVSGNHDRLTEEPTIIHKNYDFAHMFYELVKIGVKEGIEVSYSFNGHHIISLPNDNYGFIFHGDMTKGYSPVNQKEVYKAMLLCKQMYNVEPVLLLSGHYHTYIKTLLPNGGYAISVGSLLGTNQYSYTNGWGNSIPSQCILHYSNDGELIAEQVVKVGE